MPGISKITQKERSQLKNFARPLISQNEIEEEDSEVENSSKLEKATNPQGKEKK